MNNTMTVLILLIGIVQVFGTALAAAPISKTFTEVLREPLLSEDLSCTVNDTTITIQGPTFRYVVDRATGVISDLEAVREDRVVLKLHDPSTLWLDDVSLAKSSNGNTQILVNGKDRVTLLTEGKWRPDVSFSIRNIFYNDGVLVSEISLMPDTDIELHQGIRYEITAAGCFTHYLHKRRDNEGTDCFKGALPKAGETIRMNTPTSCLEAFSSEAALAMFTDMGDFHRSPAELDTAAIRVDSVGEDKTALGMHQHIIHVGPNETPYILRAGESFKFRAGLAVAPNRLPHPRWRDLRMFIWAGDDKFPYPSDDEIQAVARLGFTLFQMHRLGPPGEPRPPAEELDRVIKMVHDAGMLFIWTANADLQYAHAKPVATLVNEGNWVRWQGFNYGGKYTAKMDAFCNTLATCLASPNGLAEYRMECNKRMLERYPVDGMYIDDNLAYANCPLWKEHGHPQKIYDCLIELHDVNWQRRQVLRNKCPHAVLIDHCSHGFVLPVISAFDCHLFGEGYSFPSVEAFRDTFGSFKNMYAQGCLFAGDSETTRCGAEVAYAFDLLTGGGQYCYLDWRLWPKKFPYAAGVNQYEPLFVKTYNLAQYDFGMYECDPFIELETNLPGTYGALYHNHIWNETLVVLANMNKTAATCSLAAPGIPYQSLGAPGPAVVYDVHQRKTMIIMDGLEGVPFSNIQLSPFQVRLFHLRKAPTGAVYHQWGGKRISEQWDAAAQKFSLRIQGPAGLEGWVVLGTGGNTIGQVTVDKRPAEFFADSERGFVYGKVTFGRDPVLLETIPALDAAKALPQQPVPPDELITEYR
ncbi:MAG TPA: hypothetical protein PLI09_22330 [Candidatus Hydrogenedentes bacterium]|nr:hypothetical protein [Candidatus Hydrogenedentota bacterium]